MTPDESRVNELHKAGERIQAQRGQYGGARPAALAWLVTFLQEDAAAYSVGELTDRWWEVLRFCRDGGLGPDEARLSNLRSVGRSLPGRLAGPYDRIRPFPGSSDRYWLRVLQSGWFTHLKHYIAGGEIPTGDLLFNFKVQKAVSGFAVTVPNDDAAFAYQLIHLLAELGPRIRQCRHCNRVVLAGRSDKEFCSGSCQATIWKLEHPRAKGKKQPTAKKARKTHGTKR